jgi:hypothetical protein
MAIKSAWAYRNGKKMMKESRDIVANIEAEKKEKHEAALPELKRKRELAREAKDARNEALFDALKVGETLTVFNLPHILIKKKNKKSIITSTDVKLLKSEVFGAMNY